MENAPQVHQKAGGAVEISPKLLAFYLPQFHPNPENNVWWGDGYTEWTNVARAKPLYPGHYQPKLPADLGFYDLRLPETREAQAALAREYGVHGFCYYHYWFKGRRVLQRPFDEVLESGRPDFPFCLCWANHTWTWKRDHNFQGRLADQEYSEEDDREHIRWLLGTFRDERYIRIKGRPLMLIYWTQSLPEPERTFDLWRREASEAGEAEPYIVKVDSFGNFEDPRGFGCDAAVEFWPHAIETMIPRVNDPGKVYKENQVFEYRQWVLSHLARKMPEDFKRFPCVVPQWDNTARWKSTGARILRASTPELYESWLEGVIQKAASAFEPEEQLIFINAWNEWGGGTYLEPDIKHGRAYLEATRQAMVNSGAQFQEVEDFAEESPTPASAEERYQKLLKRHEDLQRRFTERLSFDERAPVLQMAEQRYNRLLQEHTKLRHEHAAQKNNYTNAQTRLARAETQLANIAHRQRVAVQQHAEADQLISWLKQLDRGIMALLGSRRWKVGNAFGKVTSLVLRRPESRTAEDHLLQVLQEFRTWSRKSEARKGKSGGPE